MKVILQLTLAHHWHTCVRKQGYLCNSSNRLTRVVMVCQFLAYIQHILAYIYNTQDCAVPLDPVWTRLYSVRRHSARYSCFRFTTKSCNMWSWWLLLYMHSESTKLDSCCFCFSLAKRWSIFRMFLPRTPKFVTKRLRSDPPHLKRVGTLPCEISMSKITVLQSRVKPLHSDRCSVSRWRCQLTCQNGLNQVDIFLTSDWGSLGLWS